MLDRLPEHNDFIFAPDSELSLNDEFAMRQIIEVTEQHVRTRKVADFSDNRTFSIDFLMDRSYAPGSSRHVRERIRFATPNEIREQFKASRQHYVAKRKLAADEMKSSDRYIDELDRMALHFVPEEA